eukprot:5109367-Prorocentrum_lima.AAC.1
MGGLEGVHHVVVHAAIQEDVRVVVVLPRPAREVDVRRERRVEVIKLLLQLRVAQSALLPGVDHVKHHGRKVDGLHC